MDVYIEQLQTVLVVPYTKLRTYPVILQEIITQLTA